MNSRSLSITLFTAVALTTALLHAAPLQKGDPIPDVTVRTEENQELKLRSLVAAQPTVLIFYRGGWCPYCTRHLSALVDIEADLKTAGIQMLAISMDQPSKIKQTPNRDSLQYTLLSDSDAAAAEAFGIAFTVPDDLVKKYKESYKIDLEAASGRAHHKLPHPGVFVISTDGVIQFAHVNEDYKQRLDPQEVLAASRAARQP
jgi:peroxiredoxin